MKLFISIQSFSYLMRCGTETQLSQQKERRRREEAVAEMKECFGQLCVYQLYFALNLEACSFCYRRSAVQSTGKNYETTFVTLPVNPFHQVVYEVSRRPNMRGTAYNAHYCRKGSVFNSFDLTTAMKHSALQLDLADDLLVRRRLH